MEYITTKEASAKWGISTIRITVLANEGRIPGAQRLGKSWLIPANATKPPARKPNHSGSCSKKTKENNSFSFPLYHFRPDWSYIMDSQLSDQQQRLLSAETAILECRYADAYPILKDLLTAPDDIMIEIGCLWNAGICCICENKPEDFSKIYFRLQILLSEDFPHRNDLVIIFDYLKTYVETMSSAANYDSHNANIHNQCLPLLCMQIGYSHLTNEALNPDSADTTMLELNLRLLENTSAVIVMESMHLYLLGIYYFRQHKEDAVKHAKIAVRIAYENKYYLPLISFFRYFATILSPILAQYPEDFQNHIHELATQYEENFAALLSSISEYSVISKLTNEDQPYINAVLIGLPNTAIADKLGVSPRTVKRRLEIICEKLGVHNKKDLKDYLHNHL